MRNAECRVRSSGTKWQTAEGQLVIPALHPDNSINLFITMAIMAEGRKKFCFPETKKYDFLIFLRKTDNGTFEVVF
jgi:hypothetical protein